MKLFNPNQAQMKLYLEAGRDAQERIAVLKEKIAQLEAAKVELPAVNESGENILNGVNTTILNIITLYRRQIDELMVLANNAKE